MAKKPKKPKNTEFGKFKKAVSQIDFTKITNKELLEFVSYQRLCSKQARSLTPLVLAQEEYIDSCDKVGMPKLVLFNKVYEDEFIHLDLQSTIDKYKGCEYFANPSPNDIDYKYRIKHDKLLTNLKNKLNEWNELSKITGKVTYILIDYRVKQEFAKRMIQYYSRNTDVSPEDIERNNKELEERVDKFIIQRFSDVLQRDVTDEYYKDPYKLTEEFREALHKKENE